MRSTSWSSSGPPSRTRQPRSYSCAMGQTDLGAEIGTCFLEALTSRDYSALAACFAADATLRAIVPSGTREDDGRETIAARFRMWTEDVEDYEVGETESTPFADLLRLRWSVKGVDPELGLNAYEQTAYAEVADGAIVRMRLACSGHRPL